MARRIVVELLGDSSSLERSFKRSGNAGRKFNNDLDRAGRGALAGSGAFGKFGRSVAFASTPFLGAAGLVAAVKSSVSAASDMNEQMSKTDVVFGKSAAQVKAWSQTTTEAFGLSKRQAVATASSFGALFRPLGIAGQQAADQSQKLTQLGADLASFYNTDVSSALDAIRSGIVGESEPLRQYGVLLSETRVQQEALRETGRKHVTQLTAQEKALARIKLIFDDTAQAQGDYARTADGLANQTRTLSANIDNLQVAIGQKLVPALTDATTKANEFLASWDQAGTTANDVKFALGVIGDALDGLRNNKTWGLGKLATPLWDALAAGPRRLMHAIRVNREFFRDKSPVRAGPHGDDVAMAAMKAVHGTALSADIAAAAAKVEDEAARKFRASAGQRNTWFDAMISRMQMRAGLLPALTAQISALQRVQSLLKKRLAVTKDITRQQTLEDEILQNAASISGIRAQITADRQQAAEERKQAAEARAEAREEAIAAAKQDRLGWLEFAVERADATKTLKDDLSAAEAILGFWKQEAATGKRTFDEARNVWEWQQKINDLRKKMKHSDDDSGFRHLTSSQIVGALGPGVSGAATRRIVALLSTIGPRGSAPRSTGQFALAGGTTIGVVNVHGVQNVAQLNNELVKHAKGRSKVRRGARG